MSYKIELDGKTTFICNGCKREATAENSKQLPMGWCVVGVLETAPDPESDTSVVSAPRASEEDLADVGALIGAHYHNEPCGMKALHHPNVALLVGRLKIALALYWGCILVVDGTGEDVGVGRSTAHDVHHDDVTERTDEKPRKRKPFQLGEGGPQI